MSISMRMRIAFLRRKLYKILQNYIKIVTIRTIGLIIYTQSEKIDYTKQYMLLLLHSTCRISDQIIYFKDEGYEMNCIV